MVYIPIQRLHHRGTEIHRGFTEIRKEFFLCNLCVLCASVVKHL
jgi:hypothetical protein